MKTASKGNNSIHLMLAQTKDFVFYMISIVSVISLGILEVVIMKSFVDKVIVGSDFSRISTHVVPFVLIFITIALFLILKSKSKAMIIANMSVTLTKDAYHNILISDYNEEFYSENKKYVERIIENCQVVSNYYIGNNILPFIEIFTGIVAIFIASLIVQPIFALVVLLLIPFYCMAVKGIELFTQKTDGHYKETLEKNQKKINDTYDKLKNIKLKNGIKQEEDSLSELTNEYISGLSMKKLFSTISKTLLIVLFSGLQLAIILGVGGVLFRTSGTNVSAGSFVFYGIITPILFIALYRVLHYDLVSEKVEIAEEQLTKLFNLKTEYRSEPVTNLDEIHTVKFKEVVYVDNNNQKIVNNLTFEVKRGEKIGIFAIDKESKKAIFECITKLSKFKEGTISINNCDITKISPTYLRTIITSVFEDSSVIDGTIMQNVCYPETFDEYKYNDALYKSGLKTLISKFTDKDNTFINAINEDSEYLYKRLVFANAFYKDSKIYLLNDATENLSPTVETEILNEVFKLKNKIVIMLTDKSYLLSKCDKILILENGEEVEYGKYSELITDKESRFYKMIKKAPTRRTKIS